MSSSPQYMNGSSLSSFITCGSGFSLKDGAYPSLAAFVRFVHPKKGLLLISTYGFLTGWPCKTACSNVSLGVATFTFWLATNTRTFPQSNLSPSWPITLQVGLHRVPPRIHKRLLRFLPGKMLDCKDALWVLLGLYGSKFGKTFIGKWTWTKRGALPRTHCDGEKPPTRDVLFFTMQASCKTDSTCSLPRG